MKYRVADAKNVRLMNDAEKAKYGTFDSEEAALDVVKRIINEWLDQNYQFGMTFQDLYRRYFDSGPSPFITSEDDACEYPASRYAKERCEAICGKANKSSFVNAPTKLPKVDRSNCTYESYAPPYRDTVEIGWNEGVFNDGRPYRLECWARDQATFLTYFFSALEIEGVDKDYLITFLEKERMFEFISGRRGAGISQFIDRSGNEMWSVTVCVGQKEDIYVRDFVTIKCHPKSGRLDLISSH